MKKKGFTLIELLAVIGILSLLLLIAVPTVMRSRNAALNKMTEEQKNSIIQAGETLGVDLDDPESDVFNCNSETNSWIECEKSNNKWISAVVSIGELKNHDYFDDKGEHCNKDGKITITKQYDDATDEFIKYSVDFDANVTCK